MLHYDSISWHMLKKHPSDLVQMNVEHIPDHALVKISPPPLYLLTLFCFFFFLSKICSILIFNTDTKNAIYYVKPKNACGNTGFYSCGFLQLELL